MLVPKRKAVKQACDLCRRKRIRCDGEAPCEKCFVSKEECIYGKDTRTENEDLRAEVKRLKTERYENNTLIQLLISDDTRQTVLQGLKQGTPRELLINSLAVTGALAPLVESTAKASHSVSGDNSIDDHDADLNASHLQSPELAPLLNSTAGQEPLGNSEAAVAAAPPTVKARLEKYEMSLIEELFNYALDEDCMPLKVLSKTDFLHDYIHKERAYCSPALVNAVLALACQMISLQAPESILLNVRSPTDEMFFYKAQGQLFHLGLSSASLTELPEIQAIGFLALHQVAKGNHRQARQLAEAFLDSTIQLCRRMDVDDIKDMHYAKIRSETFRSAVSLLRMIDLCVTQLSGAPEGPLWPGSTIIASYEQTGFREFQLPHLDGSDDIPASMFRLTEWVCHLLHARNSDGQTSDEELLKCYNKCLSWYGEFLTFAKAEESPAPFILFVHIYYHFCILCLFRPFVEHIAVDVLHVSPNEICDQAAQAIIALTQTYGRLYSLRQVSGFVPYFVFAASTLQLSMGSKLSGAMSDPFSAKSSGNSSESGLPNTWDIDYLTATRRFASAHVSDARLLLADMASTHKFAANAGRHVHNQNNTEKEKSQ